MTHEDKSGPSRPGAPAPPDKEALEKILTDHGLELRAGRIYDIYTGRALGTFGELQDILARLKARAGS